MELKDIVIDLDLAKKLKELNVPQNSLFKYFVNGIGDFKGEVELVEKGVYIKTIGEYYSAFTIDELLEMLPNKINIGRIDGERYLFTAHNTCIGYAVNHQTDGLCCWVNLKCYKGLEYVNKLSELLIDCIEQGYVKIE